MSVSLRWSGTLAVAALAMLAHLADAQGPASSNRPQVMPAGGTTASTGAAGPNVGGTGSAATTLPPNLPGYNALPPGGGYGPTGPAAVGMPAYDPYKLSTVPNYNPYLAGSGSMSTGSPYTLSTSPTSGGAIPSVLPFGPGFGDLGLIGAGPGVGYGAALQGLGSYTQAAGRYWIDIEAARMSREQVSQMQIETARRRIQFEAWYESVRPTAGKMMEAERATEIDIARKGSPDSEIVSGKALNTLLRSIQTSGRLSSGPRVPLDENILKQVNLSGGGAAGNVGMLKEGVNKLAWPEVLQDSGYDEARKRLTTNLKEAVETVSREPVPNAKMKDIRADYATINTKLNEGQDDISPSQYIEARRFLNQLNSSITALRDPNASKYFNNTWNAKGNTVAELVEHMTREGLTFAPAAQGEDAAYRAVYGAMQRFEVGMQMAQR